MARAFIDRNTRPLTRCAGYLRVGIAAWIVFNHAPEALGEEPSKPKAPPTFTKDVAPILQKKCQNCHRRHQVGPFALETYEQARKRAADIATVAADRLMPPWKPERGVGPKLKHDQSLSREEIAILEAWAEAGAPQGDPKAHAAAARVRRGLEAGDARPRARAGRGLRDPRLGPGHLSLLRDPHEPRAGHLHLGDRLPAGESVGSCITSTHSSTRAATRGRGTRPSRGRDTPRSRGRASTVYEELSFWAAGHEPSHLPAGIGQRLPRQSDVILQIHYHPTGKARGRPHAHRGLFLARAGQAGAPLEHRVELGIPAPGGRLRTSRSRRAGTSPPTSRSWPSPPTCTCSGTTCACR